MKRTKCKNQISEPTILAHTCEFPIWIIQGKLVDTERQVAQYLTAMFSHSANSGEVALKATAEIKVLAKKR